jgi:transposase
MAYFAGLDVSVKETSVCILDDTGNIVRERRVASEPEALLQVLTNTIYRFKRVGLEAGPLSQWLYSVLAEAGLPVICVETRHMRDDARGLAQMMRVGLCRPVQCEDVTQSETSNAADPSQATSVEGHRHRERPACHVAQLRP